MPPKRKPKKKKEKKDSKEVHKGSLKRIAIKLGIGALTTAALQYFRRYYQNRPLVIPNMNLDDDDDDNNLMQQFQPINFNRPRPPPAFDPMAVIEQLPDVILEHPNPLQFNPNPDQVPAASLLRRSNFGQPIPRDYIIRDGRLVRKVDDERERYEAHRKFDDYADDN